MNAFARLAGVRTFRKRDILGGNESMTDAQGESRLHMTGRWIFSMLSVRFSSYAIVMVAFVVALSYEISPFLDRVSIISEEGRRVEYEFFDKRIREQAVRSVDHIAFATYERNINLLTKVYIYLRASTPYAPAASGSGTAETEKMDVRTIEAGISLRYDNLILFVGAFFVAVIAVRTLSNVGFFTSDAPVIRPTPADKTSQHWWKEISDDVTATRILLTDVTAADYRTRLVFGRSTLLLVAGVTMAFIGVTIFYVTLPESGTVTTGVLLPAQTADGASRLPSPDIWGYVRSALRPTGVLIFLEAIAWFLLRQYRALIEDYKWFYRVYVKRVNYLAAVRLLAEPDLTPEKFAFAAVLMREEFSERLKSGETTETIERLKLPEDGPLKDLLSAVEAVYRRSPASRDKKPDGATAKP
jgi:hypothetical protein